MAPKETGAARLDRRKGHGGGEERGAVMVRLGGRGWGWERGREKRRGMVDCVGGLREGDGMVGQGWVTGAEVSPEERKGKGMLRKGER